jgi:hypothetical protein
LWEAGFATENARHGRALDDVAYVVGCCFRSVACLCQVLFAVNRTYLLNEKGAVLGAQRLPLRPKDFSRRVARGLGKACAGDTASAVENINALVRETEALAASQP